MLNRPMNNTAQDRADKFDVKELIEFERFCRDNALWDEMKKCYAPGAAVDISWYQGSGYGFVDASGKMELAVSRARRIPAGCWLSIHTGHLSTARHKTNMAGTLQAVPGHV